ncbi:MAG TPA: hypothetical protein VJ797_07365 [Burkholderiales bacterium]|nr:hypothetical protein [Burkholderiales bacterium]
MPRILVAAGDDTLRIIEPAIEAHAKLLSAPRIEQALRLVGTRIDAVVCDAGFDDGRMFVLLHALRVLRPKRSPPVICCARRTSSEPAREAIEAAARSLGACAFVQLGELAQRYDRSIAGEILAQMVRRRIKAGAQGRK